MSGDLEGLQMHLDRSQSLFARGISMTDLYRRGWTPTFEFKDLEHSRYPFATAPIHLGRDASRMGLRLTGIAIG